MIGMTARAAKKIRQILGSGTATSGTRIDERGNPCSPSYRFALVDQPVDGDHRLEGDGIRIYFRPSHARSLFNVEIDHDGAPDVSGSNAKRTAPCG